jgi:Mg-chelatase subunit ChlD
MKRTKKTKLTNLIIIDASSSMRSKKDEVIGGLKQLLNQIKEDANKDKKSVSTSTIVVDFSSAGDFKVLVNSNNSEDLSEKLAEGYSTRGMTALFDAIGKGFNLVDKNQDSVFVNIITDGAENDSKEFTKDLIKKLITEARTKNWVITFMGTTEQSIDQAESYGISRGNTVTFMDSAKGVGMAINKLSAVRKTYYAAVTTDGLSNEQLDNLMQEEES